MRRIISYRGGQFFGLGSLVELLRAAYTKVMVFTTAVLKNHHTISHTQNYHISTAISTHLLNHQFSTVSLYCHTHVYKTGPKSPFFHRKITILPNDHTQLPFFHRRIMFPEGSQVATHNGRFSPHTIAMRPHAFPHKAPRHGAQPHFHTACPLTRLLRPPLSANTWCQVLPVSSSALPLP